MLLINKNVKPSKTIYYIATLVYKHLNNSSLSVKQLYENIQNSNESIDYMSYINALNFLYLIEKIRIAEDVIKLC